VRRIKLCDFADSDLLDNYPSDWHGSEVRYCPPGSDRPQRHNVGTMKRERFALGIAVYEIVETPSLPAAFVGIRMLAERLGCRACATGLYPLSTFVVPPLLD